MTAREIIEGRLNAEPAKSRKFINVRVQENQLEQLEVIAGILTERSGKRVSKNMLIEDAINALITGLQEEGMDLDQIAKEIAQM